MPSFNGVAAGSTATLHMPIGLTYHALNLVMGGTTFDKSHITEMRLKGNGREILVDTGTDLDIRNQFHNLQAVTAGQLMLDFERAHLRLKGASELTAIGTGAPRSNGDPKSATYNPTPLSTLQLEVDIAATAVAPTLSAKALQSGPRPLGVLTKRRRFFRNPTGAGTFEISDLPTGDVIEKIYIKHTGNVTNVILDRDNFRSFDRTVAENSLLQLNGGIRTPQTNWFVIDTTERGNGDEVLVSNVNDFRLVIETSAADSLTIFVDYLGPLSGN